MSNITTRKYITHIFPGSFFSEESVSEVESFDKPASLPGDCFGYRFHETDFATVGGKEYTGETRRVGNTVIVGWIVPLEAIPANADTYILRGNIERNSPTQEAVRTRMGNWQQKDETNQVISPEEFTYTAPNIYKKAQAITQPLEGI